MAILSRIGSCFKSPGNLLRKGVGAAALGCVLYDAHYAGKIQSDLYASEKDAASTGYYLNNTLYSTNMSKIQDKIKDMSYKMELDQGYKRFFNAGIGYIKGFVSMGVNHIVPLLLGFGALLTKGLPAKLSTAGLGVYAGYELLKNFFGWGVPGSKLSKLDE